MAWAQQKGIALNYIELSEPNQNAYIERFNKTYRTVTHPSETFRVLKEGEMRKFDEYPARRLVLEAYDAADRRR